MLPVALGFLLACASAPSSASLLWGLPCLVFATWSLVCLLVVPHLAFLPGPLPGIVFKLTCMSDSDLLWTLDLAVRDLARLVDSLSTCLANLERRLNTPVGYWEIVAEESPFGIRHSVPASHFLCAEWGPPPTPETFLEFAKDHLVHYPGCNYRVTRAWEAGFWANIALATHTNYAFAKDIPLEEKQWVIYRAPGLARPCRVSDRLELDRLVTLPGPLGSPIVQGFATELEVKIFCAGGGRVVPALLQWRSLQ